MKQSPVLKLLQARSLSLARMFLLPFTWYSLCPGLVLGRGGLNAEATPPSCGIEVLSAHGGTSTHQGC